MSKRRRRPAPYHPRVWGAWILIACGWLLARLPLQILVALGRTIGKLAFAVARSRRHITRVNLALCFPELDAPAQQRLARDVFRHAGVSLCEQLVAWLNPRKPVARRFTVTGAEHLRAAIAEGRGVLLVGAHFSCMDFASQALAQTIDIDVMYRANRNPAWEWLQVHGRQHYFDGVIERDDTRQTLRRLKAGRAIWYAADQDYGRKHSVFAPFFGIPAATITATARLARFNGSPVLFMRQHRNLADLTWEVEISAPIDGYPSGDDGADATRLNAIIEAAIRRDPAQYLWLHRRFKTRPAGEARPY
jgi:Kdo2-lipid IVA lauroyltransferase/acyltransferase